MSAHYKSLSRRASPDIVRLFPLSGTVLLPGCDLPLNIYEPRYLNMVDDALKTDRLIAMIQTRDETLCNVGGLGRITQFSELDDGRYLIVLRGLRRFRLGTICPPDKPYQQAQVRYDDFLNDPDFHVMSNLPEALRDKGGEKRSNLTAAMRGFAKSLGVEVDWDSLKEIPLPRLIDQAAMISPFRPEDKQSLLEAVDSEERRRLLIGLMHLYTHHPDGDNGAIPQ